MSTSPTPSLLADLDPDEDVIWCDEAGFTGDNLLDADQPWFAVSAVCLSPRRAAELLDHATRALGNTTELKTTALLKSRRGRRVVFDLAQLLEKDAVVFLAQKDVAMAYKFYEYAIEPILKRNSGLLYRIGFHLFCGMILHLEITHGEAAAAGLLKDIRAIIRTGTVDVAPTLFGTGDLPGVNPAINELISIIRGYPEELAHELDVLRGNGEDKWVLDLTLTAAGRVLSEWGGRKKQFAVVIDQSKPLRSQADALERFGQGDRPKLIVDINGIQYRVGWNQIGPLRFGDSHAVPGLQLADLVASLSCSVARRRLGNDHHRGFDLIRHWLIKGSIVEDFDVLDLEGNPMAVVNSMVLFHLAEKVRGGEDPLVDLDLYVETALSMNGLSLANLPPVGAQEEK